MDDLRSRPLDFDPMTRDRFLAGALVPAALASYAVVGERLQGTLDDRSAVEVERIAEAQRFSAKLLAEKHEIPALPR